MITLVKDTAPLMEVVQWRKKLYFQSMTLQVFID